MPRIIVSLSPFQVPRKSGTAVWERAGVAVINPASIAGLLIRVLRAPSGRPIFAASALPQMRAGRTLRPQLCFDVLESGLLICGPGDRKGQRWLALAASLIVGCDTKKG